MIKIKIHIDNVALKEKLNDLDDIKMQIGRLRTYRTKRVVTLNELASEIMSGKAFLPCEVIDGNAKCLESWNVKNFQLLCIDVDNAEGRIYTSKEVMTMFYNDLGIAPIIKYDTFSSTDQVQRFRLIYVFNKAIPTATEFQDIYRRLSYLYPDIIDVQCSNSNRVWQGTNKIVNFNSKMPIIDKDSFVHNLRNKTSNIEVGGTRITKKSFNLAYKTVKSFIRKNLNLNFQYLDEIVSIVKDEIDILAFLQEEGFIVKDGNDKYKRGICPFHEGADNSHGFFVNIDTQKAFCMTHQCTGGDVIDITQTIYSISFYDALQKLISDYNIDLPSYCYKKEKKELYNTSNLFNENIDYSKFIEEE